MRRRVVPRHKPYLFLLAPTLAGLVAATVSAAPAQATEPAGTKPVSLVVGVRDGASPAAAADRLDARPGIKVVDEEPVAAIEAIAVDVPAGDAAEAMTALHADPAVVYVERNHVVKITTVTADDPLRGYQRTLDRATVPGAWQHTTGAAGVVVAVVDTGVTEVSELTGRVLPGYDAIARAESATVPDDHGHGTLTASVIAARGGNAAGMAGVCWECSILPVKAMDSDGYGTSDDIAAGVTWAVDNGADIVNLSLGGYHDAQVLRDAVAYAEDAGVLVVAAAGNEGVPVPFYPAAIAEAVSVGASDESDRRYWWSNYGTADNPWVDVAAPGENLAQAPDGGYYWFAGTSSAAPMVSGVAALALALNPSSTVAELRDLLERTAAPVGSWVAHGRVDAEVAAWELDPPADASGDVTAPTMTAISPPSQTRVRGSVDVTLAATDDLAGIARADLYLGTTLIRRDYAAPYAARVSVAGRNGTQTLRWRVYDLAGNLSVHTRYVIADNAGPAVRFAKAPRGKARVSGKQRVRVSASDTSGIARVELLVNGRVVDRDTSAGYAFTVRVNKYAKRYGKKVKIRVRAFDRLGNASSTPTRTWIRG